MKKLIFACLVCFVACKPQPVVATDATVSVVDASTDATVVDVEVSE